MVEDVGVDSERKIVAGIGRRSKRHIRQRKQKSPMHHPGSIEMFFARLGNHRRLPLLQFHQLKSELSGETVVFDEVVFESIQHENSLWKYE